MKTSFPIILSVSLTLATNVFAQQNDREDFGLKGEARKITSYHMDDTMEPSGEKEIAEFDVSGKMTSHKLLSPDGGVKRYKEAVYDKKGNLTDEHTWEYNRGFRETLRRFKYDKNGNVSVSAQYDNGKLTEQFMYKYKGGLLVGKFRYDEQGQAIGKEITQYDKAKKPLKRYRQYPGMEPQFLFTCQYDDAGRITDSTVYSAGNKAISKTTYVYDGQGRTIRKSVSRGDGTITGQIDYAYEGNITRTELNDLTGRTHEKHTYTYDKKHRLISHFTQYANSSMPFDGHNVTFSPEGDTLTESFETRGEILAMEVSQYDGQRRITEKDATDNEGKTMRKVIYLYDGQGNLTSQTEYNEKGEISLREENKYDDHGNLTESKNFVQGKLIHREVFKIEY